MCLFRKKEISDDIATETKKLGRNNLGTYKKRELSLNAFNKMKNITGNFFFYFQFQACRFNIPNN